MGILDQILGGLAGGQGGRAGGLGDVLGGALGGAPGGGVPGGTRAGGGQLQRMLVQAAIALVVSHAARGALGGRRGGAAAAPGARMGGAPGAGAPGLDDLLGGLLGGGRPGTGGVAAGMGGAGGLGGLGGLAAILGGAGALGPVLDAFRERGRGDAADSWVGTGANAAVEPRDVEDVFGSDAVESIARQLGIARDEAAAGLAQVLPEVVDHVTPDGRVPDADRQYASLEDLARRLGPR